MMAETPPMGWNSWNTFGTNISEDLIKEVADAFCDTGLSDAGYKYAVIDDCWSERKRNKEGLLVPDHDKFPNGMKELSSYIHGKGLKFGMYTCAGTKTCAGYPGSFEHEFEDARTFAQWDVDYLKYDYCYKPQTVPGHILYKRMAMALRNSGRDILFSACNWGKDDVQNWVDPAGAHIWRSTGDIQDNWESIKNIALQQNNREYHSGPHCYIDMDMLVVGMYGKGNVALGGCTDEEYKTHFSLWCMLNSPLMIGCDVRNMTDAAKNILTNKEMIEINQDVEARQPYMIDDYNSSNYPVYIKLLHDGSYAIGLFNLSDDKVGMSFTFWDIGLPAASGLGLQLRDVWEHEDIGVFQEGYETSLQPHSCRILKAKVVKL